MRSLSEAYWDWLRGDWNVYGDCARKFHWGWRGDDGNVYRRLRGEGRKMCTETVRVSFNGVGGGMTGMCTGGCVEKEGKKITTGTNASSYLQQTLSPIVIRAVPEFHRSSGHANLQCSARLAPQTKRVA